MHEALDRQRPAAIVLVTVLGRPSRGKEASPEAGDASSGPGGRGGDKEASLDNADLNNNVISLHPQQIWSLLSSTWYVAGRLGCGRKDLLIQEFRNSLFSSLA